MLGALALIPILIAIAIRVSGGASAGRGPAFLDQITGNGLFVGMTALVVATPLFLPLTIGVVAAVFCAAAALTVVVVGSLIGWALFPIGPVTTLSGGQLTVGEGLLRFLAIGAYVTVSMLGLSAIGLFLSTMTTVPVGAMAATAIIAVAAQIAGALPQLEWLHPWLFTDRWLDFADLLRSPPLWDSFGANALLQFAYIVVFGALAALRFTTKDVLS
jgi:ABC-2 type transport system permease protein